MRYRCVHCCNETANRAHVRLMTRLKNQRAVTREKFGKLNVGEVMIPSGETRTKIRSR